MRDYYPFLSIEQSIGSTDKHTKIYNEAIEKDKTFAYEFNSHGPDKQLEFIVDVISFRTRLTNRERFMIGDMLHRAKKICQQEKIGFQKWIEDKTDITYEMAKNYMHLYTYCLGYIQVAVEMSPTLLYKMAAPGFDKELREWLFKNANLCNITGDRFQELVQKFKDSGGDIKAIEKDIEILGEQNRIYRQIRFMVDQFQKTWITIDNVNRNQQKEYGKIGFSALDEKAQQICYKIRDSLEECQGILGKTKGEVGDILDGYVEVVREEMMK